MAIIFVWICHLENDYGLWPLKDHIMKLFGCVIVTSLFLVILPCQAGAIQADAAQSAAKPPSINNSGLPKPGSVAPSGIKSNPLYGKGAIDQNKGADNATPRVERRTVVKPVISLHPDQNIRPGQNARPDQNVQPDQTFQPNQTVRPSEETKNNSFTVPAQQTIPETAVSTEKNNTDDTSVTNGKKDENIPSNSSVQQATSDKKGISTVETKEKPKNPNDTLTEAETSFEKDYPIVKLSPSLRVEELSNNKYNINIANLLPHLKNVVMFNSQEQFNKLPFIVSYIDDHIMGGAGSIFLAQGLQKPKPNNAIYTIIRQKKSYEHPDSGEKLGIEFNIVGTAKVIQKGKNLTKMEVISSSELVEKGDRLVSRIDLDLPEYLQGSIPKQKLNGYILGVENGLWEMGKYSCVIISLGERDGLKQGNLLNALRMDYRKDLVPEKNYKIRRRHKRATGEFMTTKYGEVVIYKVFEKVSLGIIVDARLPITVYDVVTSEEQSS